MILRTFLRLVILSLLCLFFPQPFSYANPADGQGRDSAAPSKPQDPLKSENAVPASLEVKPQLSSEGAGSARDAAGAKSKSVNGAPAGAKPSSPSPAPVEKTARKKKGKAVYRQPSVLERFRDYRGERSPAALIALFDQKQSIGYRQEPSVVLSDGKTVVRLLFVSTPDRESMSDVALRGARLLAAMKDPDATNTWIIEALPEKGTHAASLSIPQRGVLMVFPLAVAPQLDIDLNHSGDVTEEDFRMFLGDRGSSRTPAYDLNGDGVRDFRDDYLFTANYLARHPGLEPKASVLVPLAPVESEEEKEEDYETGDTVEPLPPEVEPED